VLALVGIVLHVGLGSVWLSPATVLDKIIHGPASGGGDSDNVIIWQLRIPRAIGCVLVGGMLGLVGSAFQALFRNPLADPFIVGVSSGAMLGGVAAMLLGWDVQPLSMPLCGFATGLAALALVFALARRRRVVDVAGLLLAGAVTGSLLGSIQNLGIIMSGRDSNDVLRWTFGSMTPMSWERLALMAITFAAAGWLLVRQARRLNALAIGESTAVRLGVDVRRLRNTVLIAGTAMVAISVGSVGIIGFLGLAAPHIARRLLGVDWRFSMVGSMVTGSVLLLLADAISQRLGEVPVGFVTAILGAPSLLLLMRREKGLG
jgi:iron complex transport system permease protein